MITIATIFLPLFSSIFSGIFGVRFTRKQVSLISVTFIFLAAICATIVFVNNNINNETEFVLLTNWINSGKLQVNWGIYIDKLSAIMLIIVTYISALVHLYSLGYMETDPNINRFMSYLSLFTFFMLLLVTANNFIQLFCGWEGVGFCSYLLIGFWYKKLSACFASIKAFIVNRVSDFAFIIAICLVFNVCNSLEFKQVFASIDLIKGSYLLFYNYQIPMIEVICGLILIGCMGKSAQIGLHVWLPDAMEGPTPVSALIHAATMVTAGVFMIARCSYLFEYATFTLSIITIVGAVTCIFAATIAITQNDIKKIIAYSTCSQLGYMFFACGVSAYNAAIFHLFTHAFFKALLFLGAGSVIHAVSNEQDIRKMGGLWSKIPITYGLFWVGSLAIAGVFPFAGFYSKDLILEAAYASASQTGNFAYVVGVLAAFFTAFYSWRLLILVFHGNSKLDKNALKHVHESPMTMIVPMIILSLGAIVSGIYGVYSLNIDQLHGYLSSSIYVNEIHQANHYNIHHLELYIKLMPTIAGIMGILLAYLIYYKFDLAEKLTNWFKMLYLISYNKYYIDEIYDKTLIIAFKIKSQLVKIFDVKVIDRFGPDGVAYLIQKSTSYITRLQSGFIFSYAFFILIGLVLPISWFLKMIPNIIE